MVDAGGAFLNTGTPNRHDPATGDSSTPDVTTTYKSLQEQCGWSPCESLSSGHRPITITLNLPAEQLKGQKRLVWGWKKRNLPAFTNKVECQIPQECESRKMKVDEMCTCMSAILLKADQKHIGLKEMGMSGRC